MTQSPTLQITDLHVILESEQKAILTGLTLTVQPGEVHAIMGPNGAGKSTLAAVLAGKPGYAITNGSITYQGNDLTALAPDERARHGLFMAFQYPVELPGVNAAQFLRAIVNAQRTARHEEPLDAAEFLRRARAEMAALEMDPAFLQRAVNVGFSGGEKKRFDMLQAALLQPQLLILDETDSGLDIDALRAVAGGVNALRAPTRGIILITHYQRLLDYVTPDHVHVLAAGKIVRSGGPELAQQLEISGYAGVA